MATSITAIDQSSIHRITSGQVVIDLQTAVKELVENSLDAGATNIEVKFKEYGLQSIEVIDNGSGVAEENYDSIALNHHTSKLTTLSSLTTLTSFGFRGEALSSLCALCESVAVITATEDQKGVGCKLEMGRRGDVVKRGVVARQRGTTILLTNLFAPLPVRRKEFERNAKREFGKAMALVTAYALVPCASPTSDKMKKGVRLTLTNIVVAGKKQMHILAPGAGSNTMSTAQGLWGGKSLEGVSEFEIEFGIEPPKVRGAGAAPSLLVPRKEIQIQVRGLISKFSPGCGRTGTDRQFFYVNGRPCTLTKIQKAFNEVYRSFNANQAPFVVADFIIPGDAIDINVSPDKRTIFLHSEDKLVIALKAALEENFASSRSTYTVDKPQLKQTQLNSASSSQSQSRTDLGKQAKKSRDVQAEIDGADDEQPEKEPSSQEERDEDWSMGEPHLLIDPHKPKRTAEPSPKTLPPSEAEHTPYVHSVHDDSRNASPSAGEVNGSQDHSLSDNDPESTLVDPAAKYIEIDPFHSSAHKKISSSLDQLQVVPPEENVAIESSNSTRAQLPSSTTAASLSSSTNRTPNPLSPAERSTSEKSSRAAPVVISTMSASWNYQSKTDDVEPPRKKSRISYEVDLDTGGKTRKKTNDKGRGFEIIASKGDFREKMLFVAKNKRSVEDDRPEEPVELDELEEDEEEESLIKSTKKRLIRRTGRSSVEDGEMAMDVDVDINPGQTTLSKDKRPTKRGRGEPIDLTGDTTMVDDSDDDSMLEDTLVNAESQNSSASATRPEIIRYSDGKNISMRFDLSKVTSTWEKLSNEPASSLRVAGGTSGSAHLKPSIGEAAGVSNIDSDDKAADALSRIIDKGDFATMEIAGQFNLGFIVARRRKTTGGGQGEEMDDLFIVDQHAADEKYNFETLQETTTIKSQKLFRPQPLELTAADELLAVENIEVLRSNGFEVDIDEDTGSGLGNRLHLVAQPVSKSTVFDMKDLEELLHLMQDRPTGQMVRCSKARAMFAMRACRKSVMVGMPLTKNQMTTVVQHMGTIDQPWNCPHGRPTMRHLSDITSMGRAQASNVDWATLKGLK